MLVGGGTLRFGSTSFRSHVAFERRFRLHVVEREGLIYDTRYVPANRGPGNGEVFLNVLLDGEVRWHAHEGQPEERVQAPVSLLHLEDHFEGANGKFPRFITAQGVPGGPPRYRGIELRIKPADARLPLTPIPRKLDGTDRLVAAARAYVDATSATPADRTALAPAAQEIVAAFAEIGAVPADLGDNIKVQEDDVLERTWSAVASFYERLHMSPTISELVDLAGVSSRQVTRDLEKLFETFGIRGDGWRATMLQWRLRMATLLLSAPGAQVNEVASFVGYGSTEAMAHAFRDVGLPSPSEVRAALRPTG